MIRRSKYDALGEKLEIAHANNLRATVELDGLRQELHGERGVSADAIKMFEQQLRVSGQLAGLVVTLELQVQASEALTLEYRRQLAALRYKPYFKFVDGWHICEPLGIKFERCGKRYLVTQERCDGNHEHRACSQAELEQLIRERSDALTAIAMSDLGVS